MANRTWGIWTKGKLDVLQSYLNAFTTASKRLPERIYIDAFAGTAENRDRVTGEPIAGSARIALSTGSPPFTRLRFFETPKIAPKLEEVLRKEFPDRDFEVIEGDSNLEIPKVLRELDEWVWAPTFAFIDPNGMEAKWQTLEALAAFRKNEKTKAELFYLFSPPMFQRLLRIDGSQVRTQDWEAISAVFGTDDWRGIYQARLDGEIEPSKAREEYLNLMRWRMEKVLGYRWTHPLEVRNEAGHVIYYMIFTTDHPVGTKIMSNIYASAAAKSPKMRAEARRRRREIAKEKSGEMALFDDMTLQELQEPAKEGERFYEHEPPWEPKL